MLYLVLDFFFVLRVHFIACVCSEVDCSHVKLLYLDILMCYLFVALLYALTIVTELIC